ncbi:putative holin-like toxin [Aneurinibacillus tyrosinisolvens]
MSNELTLIIASGTFLIALLTFVLELINSFKK